MKCTFSQTILSPPAHDVPNPHTQTSDNHTNVLKLFSALIDPVWRWQGPSQRRVQPSADSFSSKMHSHTVIYGRVTLATATNSLRQMCEAEGSYLHKNESNPQALISNLLTPGTETPTAVLYRTYKILRFAI